MSEITINLLFWNIHRRAEATQSLVRLAQAHDAHIVLLAETPFDGTNSIMAELNKAPRTNRQQPFTLRSDQLDCVQVLSRLPKTRWKRQVRHSRYTIWQLTLASKRVLLLSTAHFPSIQNDQNDGQRECAIALRQDLERVESNLSTRFSVVIGDLNANPFDAGIAGIYGLNATGVRRTAEQVYRELNGRQYLYFYNPMWRFLNSNPPGTYYKRTSAPVCYDWFLLDQVLVRPALLDCFDRSSEQDLRILTFDGLNPLVQEQTSIPREGISDHLPLLFRFQVSGD